MNPSEQPDRSTLAPVIGIPSSDSRRFSDQNLLDLSLGRSFDAGPTTLQVDLALLNVFNEDAHDWWETLNVPPGSEYFPAGWVLPRRWRVRLAVRF